MRLDADANQWSLFGYDMRSIGLLWTRAWQDVLYSEQSPLRWRFDEPVQVHTDSAPLMYKAGREQRSEGAVVNECVQCEALVVPDALTLTRTLTIPANVEGELDAVLALEVAANSPFDADDTVSGWKEVSRSDDALTLVLIVAARSALMEWLATHHPGREANMTELWAPHDEVYVVLRGFGESRRELLYRKRLMRVGGVVTAILACIYLALGLFVLEHRAATAQVKTLQQQVLVSSRAVSERRESLLASNSAIEAANALTASHPNPHVEVARLTRLLEDGAYIAHFSMRGTDLRIRGRAQDAASVMQTLSAEPAFASVTAPQAITAVGNSGVEQFYLDLELSQEHDGETE